MKSVRHKQEGVTLIEVLLVLAIMASLLILASGYMSNKIAESRRDRTVLQVDQILNAGLAYYVNNGAWPASSVLDSSNKLESSGYLPNKGEIMSPYGFNYVTDTNTTNGTFLLCTTVPGVKNTPAAGGSGYFTSTIEASILAGRLPMAYVTDGALTTAKCPPPSAGSSNSCKSESCTLVSQVNIPGQNLNNARSVNFAGIYHNGACVPAPTCPDPSMVPSIYVAPVAVSGNNNGDAVVYPISSFTAYAVGGDYPKNTPTSPTGNVMPNCVQSNPNAAPTAFSDCNSCNSSSTKDCPNSTWDPNAKYWRVCLYIVTEEGSISQPYPPGNNNWTSGSGSVMAITRCVPTNEPSGSTFGVFNNR